jgi:hypothetical protein
MRVVGAGDADLYEDCAGKKYASSVLPSDGCTELFDWPPTNAIRLVAGSLATPQLPQVCAPRSDTRNRFAKQCVCGRP